MIPDPYQAQQELREQSRMIDEMVTKIKEATRMMDLATHEIHKRDARIADLEIECERLRGQLAGMGRRLMKCSMRPRHAKWPSRLSGSEPGPNQRQSDAWSKASCENTPNRPGRVVRQLWH